MLWPSLARCCRVTLWSGAVTSAWMFPSPACVLASSDSGSEEDEDESPKKQESGGIFSSLSHGYRKVKQKMRDAIGYDPDADDDDDDDDEDDDGEGNRVMEVYSARFEQLKRSLGLLSTSSEEEGQETDPQVESSHSEDSDEESNIVDSLVERVLKLRTALEKATQMTRSAGSPVMEALGRARSSLSGILAPVPLSEETKLQGRSDLETAFRERMKDVSESLAHLVEKLASDKNKDALRDVQLQIREHADALQVDMKNLLSHLKSLRILVMGAATGAAERQEKWRKEIIESWNHMSETARKRFESKDDA